ncbi:MAG TPA: HNH endonuclease signature motif containing protein [Candidatus Eisenbacteria bacterium]|nr:HNH endonuclease signature motif containing protein [Candidatus Eisenbacteria bacterium]
MRAAFVLKDRSDPELLAGVCAAVTRENEDVALVIAHLAEMDTRRLFAEEACSSLKSYCMEVLHLSEEQAYLRIHVARLARQFPVVLEMLADGLVHLTAVHRLGPSLTQENHLSVLEEATYQSMAKIEEIVARLRPQPPVPSRICKLSGQRAGTEDGNGLFETQPDFAGEESETEPAVIARHEPGHSSAFGKWGVSPLAPEMYEVRFTADQETVDALKLLQELLSHVVPNGDPATIIKDSLLLRLEQVKRQKFGKGKGEGKGESEGKSEIKAKAEAEEKHPASYQGAPADSAGKRPPSRYIPMEVRNAVWERDQGRCAFMSQNGRWCSERRFLEFHHVIPFAWGGETTIDNLELRCRTHNGYEGELIFGRVLRRSSAQARSVLESTRFKTSGGNRGVERRR